MAITNRDRVGKALELLRDGLAPFVKREMEREYSSQWLTQAGYSLRRQNLTEADVTDAQALLVVMWDQWNNVFRDILGHSERSLVSEIREWRNKWAHQRSFSTDDTYRALDSIARLLTAISASQAQEVERMKQDLLRLRFEEEARRERRKVAVAPTSGQPQGGLHAWREIVTPHPDVASGQYQQAEFAADLAAVYYKTATSSEYVDPEEFFRRTYLTEGLRELLRTALLRLSGRGGDPVVELQTNFGGGKTHSMLALYHLFSGVDAAKLPGVEDILAELDMNAIPTAKPIVLVGSHLSPGETHLASDGVTEIHTLWGELAWQLGGAEAFAMIQDSDRHGTSPGANLLQTMLKRFAPAVILIDEWVVFIRQTYKKHDLPAGSFDANISFVQSLTEAIKQVPNAMLVASLPASDIEIGGEGGREALKRLKNTFGRIEATWRPATAEESFEIVRRRLFQTIADPGKFALRDAVIGHYVRMYQNQADEFPGECRESDYKRRMRAAYPIHPELFDRLYSDWASLEKFQRTRGVLRLMAAVIHSLWERNDASLLIMPGMIPMDDSNVQREMTRYLEDNWAPILEADVDGPNSAPLKLDRANPNLGRYSASRRVARTIFLGSAPIAQAANPGLDDRHIKLGCVQPGESIATFGDALRRLANETTHLYVDGNRYWFSTQPSVTRLARDRAADYRDDEIWAELKKRLRQERRRGDFAAVHTAPESLGDVPDEDAVRLVILGPEYPHTYRNSNSPARQQAQLLLDQRGSGPRINRNMLVFLAADSKRLGDLEEAIRRYLAWKSIYDEREMLNLNAFQTNQARTQRDQADETVDARIAETYTLVLVPEQFDAQKSEVDWEENRVSGQGALAERVSKKLISEELLITHYSATRLRMEMDSYNLWGGADHVSLKQLWEYYARYLYLSRLRDRDVLLAAVQEGFGQLTWQEAFAYAEGWDQERGRYLGLKAGQQGSVVFDAYAVLVRPEAAQRQLDADAASRSTSTGQPGPADAGDSTTFDTTTTGPTPPVSSRQKVYRRFYGSVELDPLKAPLQVKTISDEIIQHLQALVGSRVTITLEIEAYLPDGSPENVVRTVNENARTLKFSDFGFEEE